MTLVVSVMLIVFVSIAVLGVTTFIIQRLSQAETKRRSARCLYLAQAGVHHALYNFRFHDLGAPNGYFTLGQTNIDADNYFDLTATDADLLMVNTSTAVLGGAQNRDLLNLSIQNATNSRTITINRMIVTWNNSRNLSEIVIGNLRRWQGNAPSGVNADLSPPVVLNITPTSISINRLRFSGDMTGATINVQFVMNDIPPSIRSVNVFPASPNYNFTVKSTGRTTGSNIARTILADYNALTARIFNYREQ